MPSLFSLIPGTHLRKLHLGAGTVRATDGIFHPVSTVFVNGNQSSYWKVSVAQELKKYVTLLFLLCRRGSLVLPLFLATKQFATFQKSSKITYDL